jgi:CheY-like chemotaxis protein
VRERPPRDAAPEWRGDGLVLLVEDDPLLREVFQMMLEDLGFEVLAAESGRAGIEAFERHAERLRAAMLDEALGDMTGWDALRRMREIRADIPALLCSGYPYSDDAPGLKANGWAGFLQKPFTPDGLRDRMRSLVEIDAARS